MKPFQGFEPNHEERREFEKYARARRQTQPDYRINERNYRAWRRKKKRAAKFFGMSIEEYEAYMIERRRRQKAGYAAKRRAERRARGLKTPGVKRGSKRGAYNRKLQ